jgi:hypothetical protein
MRIKRTPLANQPRATVWISDPISRWDPDAPYSDTAYVADYPTHSQVFGPDGRPLEYEPRQKVGFDLGPPMRYNPRRKDTP